MFSWYFRQVVYFCNHYTQKNACMSSACGCRANIARSLFVGRSVALREAECVRLDLTAGFYTPPLQSPAVRLPHRVRRWWMLSLHLKIWSLWRKAFASVSIGGVDSMPFRRRSVVVTMSLWKGKQNQQNHPVPKRILYHGKRGGEGGGPCQSKGRRRSVSLTKQPTATCYS